MSKLDYDVIIIGAGMGGLVCANYLSKAGKKVLVVEKNHQVGGCCVSFKRNGFEFDACVHSLGSCREGGYIDVILNELDLKNRIKFIRSNPSDTVYAPDYEVRFENDRKCLIDHLQSIFPKESLNIERFVDFLVLSDVSKLYLKLSKCTLADFLSEYFFDYKLKAILAVPILGNGGLPPSLMSGFIAAMLYKEFLFDGGYYPVGGMQSFSNTFRESAESYGCDFLMSSLVEGIKIDNGEAVGVVLADGTSISCQNIVANCSVKDVFEKMLPVENFEIDVFSCMSKMSPSLSMLSVYLGINEECSIEERFLGNNWIVEDYDIESAYAKSLNCEVFDRNVIRGFFYHPKYENDKKKIISVLCNVSGEDLAFFDGNEEEFLEYSLDRLKRNVPDIASQIRVCNISSPKTIFHYTSNSKGAAYGWAPTVEQSFNMKYVSLLKSINNLFFVGHWTGQGLGIPTVMTLGRQKALKMLGD